VSGTNARDARRAITRDRTGSDGKKAVSVVEGLGMWLFLAVPDAVISRLSRFLRIGVARADKGCPGSRSQHRMRCMIKRRTHKYKDNRDTRTMQIIIKKLDGQKKPFNFEPEDTVLKVKEVLAEKTGVNKEQIRLIFQGSPMVDNQTLTQQKVKAGDVIHMIMQLRGG